MNSLLIRRCILVFISAFLWTACCWGKTGEPDANRITTRITHLEFSQDGGYMALVIRRSLNGNAMGHDIQLWSVETGKMLWTAEGPGQDNALICFSPDGSKVALASLVWKNASGTVRMWDTVTGKQGQDLVLKRHDQISALAFSPDGKSLTITISQVKMLDEKSEIKLFDIETGEVRQTLISLDGTASLLKYSSDGQMLIAVLSHKQQIKVQDTEVVFWNSSDYSVKQRVSLGKVGINRLSLSHDTSKVALLGSKRDGIKMHPMMLTLWNVETKSFQLTTLPADGKERVTYISFTPDGGKLIVVGSIIRPLKGEVWILSGSTGDILGQLNAEDVFGEKKYADTPAALLPNGQALAIVEAGAKRVELLSLEDGTLIRAFE